MRSEEQGVRKRMVSSSSGWIFLNDKFVARDEAKISVFDHGFLYGDGVFETLRAYSGRLLQVERHIARLQQSCDLIGLPLSIPNLHWPELLAEILRRNELSHASLRITISRGEGEIGLDPSLCPQPTVVIMAKPVVQYSPEFHANGVTLAVANVRRNPIAAQPPEIKSLSFLNNILAKHEAIHAGCFDALMLNMDGFLTECTTSNVFFFQQGQLFTPAVDCGILRGVTRDIVMLLATENGMSVVEGSFTLAQILAAEECFITNTGLEVMPVSHVGTQEIGSACPGVVTTKLQRLFQSNVNRFLDGQG